MQRPGHRRASCSLAALLALLVALSGCSRAGPAPTQAEYVGEADRICGETDEVIDTLETERVKELAKGAEEGGSGVDPRPDRWLRRNIIPEYSRLDASLRSIQAPDGDVAYLSDLYDDLSLRIDQLKLSPGRGRDLIREDPELRKRFATYGMKTCGRV